jgi:hypothetical protein
MRVSVKVRMVNADNNLILNAPDSYSVDPVLSSPIGHYLRWTMCLFVCNLVLPVHL